MLPLSQGQLTLFDACPRKFKYIFFDALSGPSSYEQKAKTQWGSQFHLLMQQSALDLPVEVMAAANTDMNGRLKALAKAAPEVFAPDGSAQSEQRRTLAFNHYLLTVIYDLVVETPDGAQLFDWKTHQQPPRKEWLQADWQTRLYLYVLCETTGFDPAQLSMTYCFVRVGLDDNKVSLPEPLPSFYRFGYSAAQHQKTHKDLQQLTERLTGAIALMKANNEAAGFPKVDKAKGLCESCLFNIRCDRAFSTALSPTSENDDPYQLLRTARALTAETVEEIPL
ncbi:MAG: PD-(D/E)XK nuclease family protein [Cyanobacteria bacterium P01_D01_bin.105]